MKLPHAQPLATTPLAGKTFGILRFPPLETQRQIVERIAAARAEIARERAAAAKLATDTAARIESLILGTARV